MDTRKKSNSVEKETVSVNRVAIIGASGYGGLQLVRLLSEHPFFKITFLGGYRSAGRHWNEIAPFLPLDHNPVIEEIDPIQISQRADYALLSLPNGMASQIVPKLLEKNIRVLDLSADYRFHSLDQWKQVYFNESNSFTRNDKELCLEAVYGLTEWNLSKISTARLVSCPGCYPTASLLSILPFLKQGMIDNQGVIIDAKSGTSGGGRMPKENLLNSELSEAISAYSVIGHRHTSEIENIASEIAGKEIQIQFTPHLVPMVRGILSTTYARLRDPGFTAEDCKTVLETFYKDQLSIEVLPVGVYPSTKWVRQTNKAIISVQVDIRTGRLVLISVIDNLIKGQAGQAIQNLNLMASIPKEEGLPLVPYYP